MKENRFIILLERFLRRNATPDEVAELTELFDRPESRRQLNSYYEKKWSQDHSPLDRETEERMLANLRGSVGAGRRIGKIPLRKTIIRVAAASLIPLLAAGMLYFYLDARSFDSSARMAVNVNAGQKADMILPDGTRVWLNSSSVLTYGNDFFHRGERVVDIDGEAYFEVKKDRRPFIVRAGEVSVEALGTAFNVKAYSEDNYVTTTLVEGLVRVSGGGNSDILHPNEQLLFTKSDGIFTKDVLSDAGRLVAWRNNQLAFEGEKLDEIAKVLQRMYNVSFEFEHDDLRNIRFSGRIRNNNLESILQMISIAVPVIYSFEDSTIYVKEDPRYKHLYKKSR